MAHTAQVSFRDQLATQQARREIKPDFEFARAHRIAVVKMDSGGEIPAAVGLRTTVTAQTGSSAKITDHWHVTISPFDESLLRRLYAKRNARDVRGDVRLLNLDPPVPGMVEASYDALEALRKAHDSLSRLEPSTGTIVEMTLAISRDLTREFTLHASATDLARKAATRAVNHNIREQQRFAAAHWPCSGPVSFFGRQVYPWSAVEPMDLVEMPEIPQDDAWEPGGRDWESIEEIATIELAPVLESLWKAAFVQDGDKGKEGRVAVQLRAQGYRLDQIEATRVGIGPLRELLKANRRAGNLTQLGSPDLIEELGRDYITHFTPRSR
jgi:hypothetical protein